MKRKRGRERTPLSGYLLCSVIRLFLHTIMAVTHTLQGPCKQSSALQTVTEIQSIACPALPGREVAMRRHEVRGTASLFPSSHNHSQHARKDSHKNRHYSSNRSSKRSMKGLLTVTNIMQPSIHNRTTRKRLRECKSRKHSDIDPLSDVDSISISNGSCRNTHRCSPQKDDKLRITSIWALRGSGGCVARTPNVNAQKTAKRNLKGNKGQRKGRFMIDNAFNDLVLHARHPRRSNNVHDVNPRFSSWSVSSKKKAMTRCNYELAYPNDEDYDDIKHVNKVESYIHCGNGREFDDPLASNKGSKIRLRPSHIIAQCLSPCPTIEGVVHCESMKAYKVSPQPLLLLHGSSETNVGDGFENEDVLLESKADPIVEVKSEWLDVGEHLVMLDVSNTNDTDHSDIEDGDGWLLVS